MADVSTAGDARPPWVTPDTDLYRMPGPERLAWLRWFLSTRGSTAAGRRLQAQARRWLLALEKGDTG